MKTKHTQGNWYIKETKLENTGIICQTVIMTDLKYDNPLKSPVICDLYGQSTEEGKANAKLIATAPELLKALIELMEDYKSIADSGDCGNWSAEEQDSYINSQNAIRKATWRND